MAKQLQKVKSGAGSNIGGSEKIAGDDLATLEPKQPQPKIEKSEAQASPPAQSGAAPHFAIRSNKDRVSAPKQSQGSLLSEEQEKIRSLVREAEEKIRQSEQAEQQQIAQQEAVSKKKRSRAKRASEPRAATTAPAEENSQESAYKTHRELFFRASPRKSDDKLWESLGGFAEAAIRYCQESNNYALPLLDESARQAEQWIESYVAIAEKLCDWKVPFSKWSDQENFIRQRISRNFDNLSKLTKISNSCIGDLEKCQDDIAKAASDLARELAKQGDQ